MLYLYALLAEGESPLAETGSGLGGEPVLLVRAGGIVAAVGSLPRVPAAALATLREHDAVVQRLAAHARALLPLRFGQALPDEDALRARLERLAPALRRALERVEGCEQMTWRVWAREGARPGPARSLPTAEDAGPGTRYLAQRRAQAHAQAAVPDALLPALERVRPFVRAERIERAAARGAGGAAGEPWQASVYHLVRRVDREPYDRRAGEALLGLREPRVRVSGPWPPYAFAEAWPT